MLLAETCLLQAVRDTLRSEIPLADERCDVELDDQLPSIAPQSYYAVTAGGTTPGPRHQSSGGVYDLVIDVRVTLFRRVPHRARDRRRNVYLDLLAGLNRKLDETIVLIDHSYDLLADAAQLLNAHYPFAEYPEPFRTFAPDTAPRMVYRDPYDAADMQTRGGDPIIAIARSVTFRGARAMHARPLVVVTDTPPSYFRPDGVSTYRRPDGSRYRRPLSA
jgi:hypothetical protein